MLTLGKLEKNTKNGEIHFQGKIKISIKESILLIFFFFFLRIFVKKLTLIFFLRRFLRRL